jgi:hypothetical protein
MKVWQTMGGTASADAGSQAMRDGTASADAGAYEKGQQGGTSPVGDGADDEYDNAWPADGGSPNPNDLGFDPSVDLDEDEGVTYNCDPDTTINIRTIAGKMDQQKFNMKANLGEIKTYVEKVLLVPEHQQIIIIGGERVVDSFMQGGDKSHMTLEQLGLEDNGMIFLTYEMRGGGKVKKQQLKGTAPAGAGARRKAKPQDDDDEGEDSNDEDMDNVPANRLAQAKKDYDKQLAYVKGLGVDGMLKDMVDEVENLIDNMGGSTDFSTLLMKLTLPQLKELSTSSVGVGGGRHMHDIASYLSTNFVFASEEKQLEALKNSIGSVSKLLKQVASCMYMQRYMMGAKVMHNSFHMEVVGLIEQKAMEMARTAPAGAGAGGSVVSRLLRGFK